MTDKKPSNPLAIFLIGAVVIATVLAGLGLYIYRVSGAYAVDLSRPDYKTSRQEIHHTSENERLKVSKDGKVNQQLVDEINESFKFYLKEISEEAFSERAMSDGAFGLPSMEPVPPSASTE
jgi:hypothetical protein